MKIYQARDIGGSMYTYFGQKPGLLNGQYQRDGIARAAGFTFPIPLKPLQIAEITVCEDGTWSYEIEREEGWYMAKEKHSGFVFLSNNYGGEWKNQSGVKIHLGLCTISSNRIPDECII